MIAGFVAIIFPSWLYFGRSFALRGVAQAPATSRGASSAPLLLLFTSWDIGVGVKANFLH